MVRIVTKSLKSFLLVEEPILTIDTLDRKRMVIRFQYNENLSCDILAKMIQDKEFEEFLILTPNSKITHRGFLYLKTLEESVDNDQYAIILDIGDAIE